MNVGAYLLWSFAATLLLSVTMVAAQGLGLSRVSLPYLVGTFFTADRDRARAVGFLVHLVNGWLFALVYVAGFHVVGFATWWLGALGGLLHAATVLTIGMQALPGLHPRMASPTQGPTVGRYLEPPGFLALHYGAGTPLAVVVCHMLYGALLGGLYPL
ncbi:MAG: hypothetical protein Q8O67_25145 [Deltaproteobacteria bacterium]|nr:hypothetical protein [Deltaproteobacteria bacterium]